MITVRSYFLAHESVALNRGAFRGYLALKNSVVRFELDPNKNKEVGDFSLPVFF
jgi:hypothetical protein